MVWIYHYDPMPLSTIMVNHHAARPQQSRHDYERKYPTLDTTSLAIEKKETGSTDISLMARTWGVVKRVGNVTLVQQGTTSRRLSADADYIARQMK